MQREVKMMRARIAYSGNQPNNFVLTEEAIRGMHGEFNEGKPLIDKINSKDGKVCGYLNRTELVWNKEDNRLELWGYFTYDCSETDFAKQGECAYQIAYSQEDMDDMRLLHRADLINCTMINSLD